MPRDPIACTLFLHPWHRPVLPKLTTYHRRALLRPSHEHQGATPVNYSARYLHCWPSLRVSGSEEIWDGIRYSHSSPHSRMFILRFVAHLNERKFLRRYPSGNPENRNQSSYRCSNLGKATPACTIFLEVQKAVWLTFEPQFDAESSVLILRKHLDQL